MEPAVEPRDGGSLARGTPAGPRSHVPYVLRYTAPAAVETELDDDRRAAVLAALDGYAVEEGTVLDHLGARLPGRDTWRGGALVLSVGAGEVAVVVEIEVPEALAPADLEVLRRSLDGQMADGLGAGGFEPIAAVVPVEIEPLSILSSAGSRIALAESANSPVSPPAAEVSRRNAERLSAAKVASKRPKRAVKAQDPFAALWRAILALPPQPTPESREAVAAALRGLGGDLRGTPPRSFPYHFLVDPDVVRMLLDAGLDPDLRDRDGHALLYLVGNDLACLRLVLDRGAAVDAVNEDRFLDTALKRAARTGNTAAVALLLARGADRHLAAGPQGTTALDDAKAQRAAAVVALLQG